MRKRSYFGILVIFMLLLCACGVTAGAQEKEAKKDKAKTTVLFYAIGVELEGMGAQLTSPESGELTEMMRASLHEDVNVVMQLGDCTGFQPLSCPDGSVLQISNTNIERFELQEDAIVRVETLDAETAKQHTPEELADFIEWGVEHYPAERTMLVLWDHGSGSVLGAVGMYTQELSSGIHNGVARVRKSQPDFKLTMLGMDTCLMGTMECGLIFSDIADYYAGSQEITGWHSWDYTAVLNALAENPEISMQDLSKVICDGMVKQNSDGRQDDNTQSVLDLNAMTKVKQVWEKIAGTMNAYLGEDEDGSHYLSIARAIEQAKDYNNGEIVGMSDLIDFAATVHDRTDGAAVTDEKLEELKQAVEKAVVYKAQGVGMDIACGMSVFVPKDIELLYQRKTERGFGKDFDTSYLCKDYFTAHEMLRSVYGEDSEALRFPMNLMALYTGVQRGDDSELSVIREYLSSHYHVPDWVGRTCKLLGEPVDTKNIAVSYDKDREVYSVTFTEESAPTVMECHINTWLGIGKYGKLPVGESFVSAWLETRKTFETRMPMEVGLRYDGMPLLLHITEIDGDSVTGYLSTEATSKDNSIAMPADYFVKCDRKTGKVTPIGYRQQHEPADRGLYEIDSENVNFQYTAMRTGDTDSELEFEGPAPVATLYNFTDVSLFTYDANYRTVVYNDIMTEKRASLEGTNEVTICVTDIFRRKVETESYVLDEDGKLTLKK